MLYWGEGSKSRNSVRFTNSDGRALDEIERWWLEQLDLPLSSLRQSAVNAASRSSKLRRNTLPYGTARVSHRSTFVIQSIYGAIQQYAGIDRLEWLD